MTLLSLYGRAIRYIYIDIYYISIYTYIAPGLINEPQNTYLYIFRMNPKWENYSLGQVFMLLITVTVWKSSEIIVPYAASEHYTVNYFVVFLQGNRTLMNKVTS